MTVLKPGLRLRSAVCEAQIIVVRTLGAQRALSCGGAAMLLKEETAPAGVKLDPALSGGTLVGKRYVDDTEQFEFLCTKSGQGSLVLDGKPLQAKLPKSLPSSD
jgi:hypothetical protein